MKQLIFQSYPFRLRTSGAIREMWDETRKKWIVVTPEEWVRQHLIEYLVQEKKFPRGLLSVEKGLRVNGLFKRTDVVAFGTNSKALLLAECKSPTIKLSQGVFDQAARYNLTLRVPFLLITNGLEIFCCKINFEIGNYEFLKDVPDYMELR
ncbi:MAG: type I restriction enzyme HsdR N-terminal domain-containing protein [Flavobacteriales bacterium]|nr:type I restriction enzyme HsdR N-terminal domain-containing protein [Flavobacteriales bacterium]